MRENGRSERPKNGADAQPYLSDVYKNGTRAKRRQADVPLCGRSMVEMLGVLAIIGVLSVGAMSGYAKAMFKYKLNKQAEAFNMFLGNAVMLMPELNRAFSGETFDAEIFHKLNLIPDGMTYENKRIYDIFNNRIAISYNLNPNGNVDYLLHWTMDRANNKAGRDTIEICRNMVYAAQGYADTIPSLEVRSGQSDNTYASNVLYGNERCSVVGSRHCLRRADLQRIDEMCSSCESETYCELVIYLMIKKYK